MSAALQRPAVLVDQPPPAAPRRRLQPVGVEQRARARRQASGSPHRARAPAPARGEPEQPLPREARPSLSSTIWTISSCSSTCSAGVVRLDLVVRHEPLADEHARGGEAGERKPERQPEELRLPRDPVDRVDGDERRPRTRPQRRAAAITTVSVRGFGSPSGTIRWRAPKRSARARAGRAAPRVPPAPCSPARPSARSACETSTSATPAISQATSPSLIGPRWPIAQPPASCCDFCQLDVADDRVELAVRDLAALEKRGITYGPDAHGLRDLDRRSTARATARARR